jgi:hypothetical protein
MTKAPDCSGASSSGLLAEIDYLNPEAQGLERLSHLAEL